MKLETKEKIKLENVRMKSKMILAMLLLATNLIAQKQADNWYFGSMAGVSFKTGTPQALTHGKLSTDEGCAVISDKTGQLLFYTDGISVWNKKHELMPNGTGLKGDPSSTSSGVAIPKPKNEGIYYLFTVAATGKDPGLSYSVVDISKEGGFGDVVATEKNVQLQNKVTEKLTAVTHRNGKDVWVISHVWESDEFLAFLVTETGISKVPISSKIGSEHKGTSLNTQGYMKSNPDGSNLALVLEETDVLEMFDFDNATGKVSHPISIKFPPKTYPYGVEFSPDGSILYGSAAGVGEIYQFNLQAGSEDAIQKSMTKIGGTDDKSWIGALQLANDGKIYFTLYQKEFLGVIEAPNELGSACKYKNDAVKLVGKATLGLPTFTQSFFTQEVKVQEINYFNPEKIALSTTFILNNVQFDFAKFTLKSTSNAELQKVVTLLKKNPAYKITLIGHTDNIGNKSSNIELSRNRAKSVQDYLVAQGIASDRISFEGKGSSIPIASNLTDQGRAKNRRVEFILK